MADLVNHPPHYTNHPSGIECVQITEHMNFCLGNALKYIWRCGLKGDEIEDLKKARWYLDREIARRAQAAPLAPPTRNERRPPRVGEDICGVLLTGPGEEPPSQLYGAGRV